MGFFSKLKRLWSSDKKEDPASAPDVPAASPAAVDENDADTVSQPETDPTDTESEVVAEVGESSVVPSVLSPVPERTTPPAGNDADWRQALPAALREAEPRLAVWLDIVLQGVDRAGGPLWERIRFLLVSVGAPEEEADAFVADFAAWAERMEYRKLEEFRSELQYRLALALELEDEEDERNRLFLKLHAGLERTRERFGRELSALFAGHGELTDTFWNELEELFIMADMGVEASGELCRRLRERARKAGAVKPSELRPLLAAELEAIFRIPLRVTAVNPPEVVLVIGVNGVGKTTTIAKLAYRARMQGRTVMLAAADTFRAAAVEQLGIWAERTGSAFHSKKEGSDPASVAWEAVDRAKAEQVDVLFVDTAGRLHTKANLMEELKKVRAVIAKKHPGAPHRSVLIIDATTGQNALSQTKLFRDAAGVDEIVLTKLDGTAKGGVAVALAMQFGIPITFVGLGEKMEDLRPFNGDDFARALLDNAGAAEDRHA